MVRWKKELDTVSWPARAGVLAAGLLLFFALAEGALRLFHARDVRNDIEYYIARTFSREEWEIAAKIRDTLLEVDRRPFCEKGTLLYRYRPFKTPYISINSDGFRGPEVTSKEPGEYRIVITGASISYGLYFPDDQTMPALVEKGLRERCPSCRLTVYNLGIEGYELQRDIALVERLFDRIRPDLVVFYDGGADVNYAYVWGYRSHEPFSHDGPFNEEQIEALQPFYRKTWVDYLRITRLVATAVKSERGMLPEPVAFTETFGAFLPPNLADRAHDFGVHFADDMERAARMFGERGAGTLFVFMPNAVYKNPLSPLESSALKVFDTLYPHYGAFSIAALDTVRREAARRNFPLFRDFSDIFDGSSDDMFYDFIHMTPRGNRELARRMTDLLVAEGVLDKARAVATPSPSTPGRSPAP